MEKARANRTTTMLIAVLIATVVVWHITKSIVGRRRAGERQVTFSKTKDAAVQNNLAGAGLVSWWKFDANVNDAVGGNDGVIRGSGNSAHIKNNVLVLDGINDFVAVPTTDFDETQGTYSLWVKPDFDSTIDNTVNLGGMRYNGTNQLLFKYDNTNDAFYIGKASNGAPWEKAYAPSCAFSSGEWIYLAFTWDKVNGMTAYYNGIAGAANTNTDCPTGMAAEWYIGQNPGGGGFFDGMTDNVMIFNKALSSEQIEFIHNSQKK
jgi:hypothetical protein